MGIWVTHRGREVIGGQRELNYSIKMYALWKVLAFLWLTNSHFIKVTPFSL